jgi:hypothetical protein
MYYFLLHKRTSNEKSIFFVRDATEFSDDEVYHIDNNMLDRLSPKTLNEKVNMILLNFGTKIKALGDVFILPAHQCH